MTRVRADLGVLVLVSTVMLVILFGSINFYWSRREMGKALAGELEARGVHHAHTLAVQALEPILVEDRLRLNDLVEQTALLDKEIAYAFVVGSHGEVLAHTFTKGFPVELLRANDLPQGREYQVRRIVDKQGDGAAFRDVVAPIAGGYAGLVHVGLKEDIIRSGIESVDRAVAWMVGLLMLLGIAASLVFAKLVSGPVKKLSAVSRRVSLDVLKNPERSQAELQTPLFAIPGLETEVDRLAVEFRQMVARLTEAHHQLEKTQKQLIFSDRLSIIGTIAAGLAHELNNPLAGLKNCLRRIKRQPENQAQLLRYVSMMQESADRMQRVLQGLLNLARPRRLEMKLTPLEHLLDQVTVLTGHKLRRIQVAVRREVHDGASVVWADEFQLEQALLNLVLNACDSLAERKLKDPQFQPELAFRVVCRDRHLCIEVADNGLGVPAEAIPRLFDPFFTSKPPGQGTGLGLSIAKDILRAHGGDIEVESEIGKGATFRIVLNMPDGAIPQEADTP